MSSCCAHSDDEHVRISVCHVVIHYPSEDYPCFCHGMKGADGLCTECEHPREKHTAMRTCKPASGGLCSCRQDL